MKNSIIRLHLFKILLIISVIVKVMSADHVRDAGSIENHYRHSYDNGKDSEELGEEEEEEEEWQARHLQEERVSLDERCLLNKCYNYDFASAQVVAFFENKPKIRFINGNTYDIHEAKHYSNLIFLHSKFYNFPLNLFYASKVEELDMRNCSVAHLTWENFLMADNLSILLLSENHLTEIKSTTFAYAPNLSFLFLDGNFISRLRGDSFKGLNKLTYLDLHDNRLENLPSDVFNYLPALQQLNLADNRLRYIGNEIFEMNVRLNSVIMANNLLQSLGEYAFANQPHLKLLDISHNKPLKYLVGNMRVEHLWARNCSLTRVNIYGEAINVNLQQNHIMELYFTQPESLETLNLQANSLQQIASLTQVVNLRTLDLSHNPQLEAVPDLWQIDSLERLDLSNTSLQQLPLLALATSRHLQSLNISSNLLEEIDPPNFHSLRQLTSFYIHNNNWNCYNLQLVMDLLIKPFQIVYTRDDPDDEFPGTYINGIKCMYRLPEMSEEREFFAQLKRSPLSDIDVDSNNSDNDSTNNVEELRSELKAIVGIYEQKFAKIIAKLEDLESRLLPFEMANKTIWQHITCKLSKVLFKATPSSTQKYGRITLGKCDRLSIAPTGSKSILNCKRFPALNGVPEDKYPDHQDHYKNNAALIDLDTLDVLDDLRVHGAVLVALNGLYSLDALEHLPAVGILNNLCELDSLGTLGLDAVGSLDALTGLDNLGTIVPLGALGDLDNLDVLDDLGELGPVGVPVSLNVIDTLEDLHALNALYELDSLGTRLNAVGRLDVLTELSNVAPHAVGDLAAISDQDSVDGLHALGALNALYAISQLGAIDALHALGVKCNGNGVLDHNSRTSVPGLKLIIFFIANFITFGITRKPTVIATDNAAAAFFNKPLRLTFSDLQILEYRQSTCWSRASS
uniref:Uncharacterized protein n=1 Tax=Glossina pallidipes TaxID=7398 RepID=A0A1A9ZCC7_GLOPL